jgi:hypothetical protein
VIGHAHLEDGVALALNPAAETILAVPFGIPIRKNEHGRARAGFSTCGKKLGVDGVVFRPGRFDGTGEGEDVFAIETVIVCGRGGVPFPARFDGFAGVLADECAWIGFAG